MGGGEWGCTGHYFEWVGVSGGGWDIILGVGEDEWGWVGVGALFDNALLTGLPESGEVRDFKRVREESEVKNFHKNPHQSGSFVWKLNGFENVSFCIALTFHFFVPSKYFKIQFSVLKYFFSIFNDFCSFYDSTYFDLNSTIDHNMISWFLWWLFQFLKCERYCFSNKNDWVEDLLYFWIIISV